MVPSGVTELVAFTSGAAGGGAAVAALVAAIAASCVACCKMASASARLSTPFFTRMAIRSLLVASGAVCARAAPGRAAESAVVISNPAMPDHNLRIFIIGLASLLPALPPLWLGSLSCS
jgi:hypothetical protein